MALPLFDDINLDGRLSLLPAPNPSLNQQYETPNNSAIYEWNEDKNVNRIFNV